jgi:hypothetical protein
VITPSQLQEELDQRGLYVKQRTLKDWWDEGLLPKPIPRGSGRGKGKVFGWHELDIVDRAATVLELKGRPACFKNAHHLELFGLGYRVECQNLRDGLVSFLVYVEQCVLHGYRVDTDAIGDALFQLGMNLSREQSSRTGICQIEIEDLLQELLVAVFDPSARFDFDLSDLAHTADRWMKVNAAQHLKMPDITTEMLEVFLKWLTSNLSTQALRKIVLTSEDARYEKAQQVWKSLREIVQDFAKKNVGENAAELQVFGRRFAIVSSGLILVTLLWVCYRGFDHHLDSFTRVCTEHLALVESVPTPAAITDHG